MKKRQTGGLSGGSMCLLGVTGPLETQRCSTYRAGEIKGLAVTVVLVVEVVALLVAEGVPLPLWSH